MISDVYNIYHFVKISFGVPPAITPIVASRLYWSVCIPCMTHGLEVALLSENAVSTLEQAHGQLAKYMQNYQNRHRTLLFLPC